MVTLQGMFHKGNKLFVLRRELDRDSGYQYSLYLRKDGTWFNNYFPDGLFNSVDDVYKAIEKAIELGNWSIERLHWEDVQDSHGYVETSGGTYG